jgi:nicotinamide-nucleotide amidase
MPATAEEIGKLLRARDLTLGTVESATGGLIASLITDVPGSSDYFHGAIVTYSNELKIALIGVREDTLASEGAVSALVAEQMAAGGRAALGVDICLSDTGIAGPQGATPGKPLGLFYLGICHPEGTFHRKYIFSGSRLERKTQAAQAALDWLKEYLLSLDT